MTEFAEKAKTIGVSLRKGTSQMRPVTNELDGTRAGHHVEHWDDRQDAVVTPSTVRVKVKADLEEG